MFHNLNQEFLQNIEENSNYLLACLNLKHCLDFDIASINYLRYNDHIKDNKILLRKVKKDNFRNIHHICIIYVFELNSR